MAKTPSTMLPLGTMAPGFSLDDVMSGKKITLNDSSQAKGYVMMFICNHCPFVKHVSDGLIHLANDYMKKGICFFAINSNDIETHPDDSPDQMKITAKQKGYPFPYLFDATQDVAKAYGAACTPDFFIYNQEQKLVYRGQLDDSRPGNNIPVTGESIRTALDCLLMNKPVPEAQKPSLGCNIKWKM